MTNDKMTNDRSEHRNQEGRAVPDLAPVICHFSYERVSDEFALDAVVSLFEAQLREHEIITPREELLSAVQTVIAEPRYGFMLTATGRAGEPVGLAYASSLLSMEHGGISGWLEELYVLPKWRGFGIGFHLIERVIAHAKGLGWRAIDLEVEASHERAISLYARHQFKPLTRTRFFRIL
jgi:GNAT superfamily N-acetyltransferase